MEYETSIRVDPINLLDYIYKLDPKGKYCQFFFEVTNLINREGTEKTVWRWYNPQFTFEYKKSAFNIHRYGMNEAVYKSSYEKSLKYDQSTNKYFDPNNKNTINNITLCMRLHLDTNGNPIEIKAIDQSLSKVHKSKNMEYYHEITIKSEGISMYRVSDLKRGLSWFRNHIIDIYSDHTKIKPIGVYSIEFAEPPKEPLDILINHIEKNEIYRITSSQTQYIKDYMKKFFPESIINLNSLWNFKPKTLDAMNIRDLYQNDTTYYSIKYDGVNAFMLYVPGAGILFLTMLGIYVQSSTDPGLMIPPTKLVTYFTYEELKKIYERIVIHSVMIVHGELVFDDLSKASSTEPKGFVSFGCIEIGNATSKASMIRNHTSPYYNDEQVILDNSVSIVIRRQLQDNLFDDTNFTYKHKQYYSNYKEFSESAMDEKLPSDGIIITSWSGDDTRYVNHLSIKHKPGKENTIDLYINQKGEALYDIVQHNGPNIKIIDRQHFEPIPLSAKIKPKVVTHNLKIVADEGPGIYECEIIPDRKITNIKVIRKRNDKTVTNSLLTLMSTYTSKQINLTDLLIDDKEYNDRSFFGNPVKKNQDIKVTINKIVYPLLNPYASQYMESPKHRLNILDIGGGKVGYLRTIYRIEQNIDYWINIDSSDLDLLDSQLRISKRNEHSLIKKYYPAHFDMGDKHGWDHIDSFCKEKNIKMNYVMSIFAFHFAFDSHSSMCTVLDNLAKVTSSGTTLIIVGYDHTKIKEYFDSADKNKKDNEFDLDLVKFYKPHTANGQKRITVKASFGNNKVFVEPFVDTQTIISQLQLRGFNHRHKIYLNEINKEHGMNHIIFEYICINIFTK